MICLLCIFTSNLISQTFIQNFNSSTTLTDYFNVSPSTNQFDNIVSTGSGVTVSVANNNLSFTRTTSNTGYFSRSTDFSPSPTGLIIKFDITVSGNSTDQTSAAIFYLGSSFTSTSAIPSNASCFGRLSINFTTTDGTFQIKDISNTGSNTSSDLSGTQTIRWVLNNTGVSANYTSPTGSTESLANDKTDIWSNNTKLFDDVAIETPTQSLTDFKFLFSNGTGSITIDNIEAGFASDGALPVELKSFTARTQNNNVILNWATATEINNSGFEIERSMSLSRGQTQNNRFSQVGFVRGSGTSTSQQNYSYRDTKVNSGKYEYRLKQIDLDGTIEYSRGVEVSVGIIKTRLTSNPNPFNSNTIINYQLTEKSKTTIKIYDLLGKEIETLVNEEKEDGEHQIRFNSTEYNLTSGVYFCILKTNRETITQKLVLMK